MSDTLLEAQMQADDEARIDAACNDVRDAINTLYQLSPLRTAMIVNDLQDRLAPTRAELADIFYEKLVGKPSK